MVVSLWCNLKLRALGLLISSIQLQCQFMDGKDNQDRLIHLVRYFFYNILFISNFVNKFYKIKVKFKL